MTYDWIIPERPKVEKTDSHFPHLPPPIQQILLQRNITEPAQITAFTNPNLNSLHNPFLLKGMVNATARIIEAIKNQEKIIIFGDYDVDGVTSSAILYEGLKQVGAKVKSVLPSRFKEGYGLSRLAVHKIVKLNAQLIVTVDCGINAVEAVSLATENGIEVIITDHHVPGASLPAATAIINPKQAGCLYPFKGLAGCGLAFKLLQAVFISLEIGKDKTLYWLDLVALGTAADFVTSLGENRILLALGLRQLEKSQRLGIQLLLQTAGLKGRTISVKDVVFKLAPRLNAAGRISHARKSFQLLTAQSTQKAHNLLQLIEHENSLRRALDKMILDEAKWLLQVEQLQSRQKVVVLASEKWHLGVLGIVAARLQEEILKPVVLISIKNGIGKGSARSNNDLNLISAFKKVENLLISFGGHKNAAGLTIRQENVPEFSQAINQYVSNLHDPIQTTKRKRVDSVVMFNDLNVDLFSWLKKLAPYGPDNMRPIFYAQNLKVVEEIRISGNGFCNFKLKSQAKTVEAVAYNLKSIKKLQNQKDMHLNAVFVIEETAWGGKTSIRLRIKDFEVV